MALRLTDDERDHLHRVAGAAPPSAGTVPRHVGPGVQRIVVYTVAPGSDDEARLALLRVTGSQALTAAPA
ncbi:hypothetical protein [Frigoribacterium salinisoli]